ncbi:hypothetical protein BWD42_06915 [Sphingobacterium sp. CZ-UAM]|uniref:hypothetical protein n=1 Tax=Sphingobacterium sp. CZ-UAM TaxID=1933868 RepID=UPI0009857F45|nr:hypothetical protein [Sphingobacterium sp. CZ-UAM]OOG19636.1 hypothetical protein BWD42_06915 [Sphingobacterium sp. CZ-UAM]
MNWTNFLLILTLSYLTYYGLNLIYDLFISQKRSSPLTTDETLIFEEHIQPQLIEYTGPAVSIEIVEKETIETIQIPKQARPSSNTFISTGAVGLKDLFNLAKNNLIEYTSTIPY